MKLRVTIQLDNEAFQPEAGSQVSRILRNLADSYDGRDLLPGETFKLFDINGNHVGKAEVGRT
jgi:hypothetical protein